MQKEKMTQDLKAIGKRIVKLRQDRNMTQEDLCGVADIDRSFLSEIENGHKNFSIQILYKLAKALDVKPEVILSGDE